MYRGGGGGGRGQMKVGGRSVSTRFPEDALCLLRSRRKVFPLKYLFVLVFLSRIDSYAG